MSGTTDKIKGNANEAIGTVKQTLGRMIGSDRLEVEGQIQGAKGEAQKAAGAMKANVKSAVNKTSEAMNKHL